MDFDLLTEEGYFKAFHFYVGQGMTHQGAWEKIESLINLRYGKVEHKGYSTYASFKKKMSQRYKHRKTRDAKKKGTKSNK